MIRFVLGPRANLAESFSVEELLLARSIHQSKSWADGVKIKLAHPALGILVRCLAELTLPKLPVVSKVNVFWWVKFGTSFLFRLCPKLHILCGDVEPLELYHVGDILPHVFKSLIDVCIALKMDLQLIGRALPRSNGSWFKGVTESHKLVQVLEDLAHIPGDFGRAHQGY